ncbi:MAG: TIGR00341 family protein [Actinomycetota bacterium]
MTGLQQSDLQRVRDQLFFEGPDLRRRLTRYWLLLPLSAVIAAAGVVSDSTATVIGAMIVAPLMTPILGVVLAVVLGDGSNLRRCLLLLLTGAVVVVGLAWVLGLFIPYPVVAATSSQVASRISPRLVDLVAALATGAVGSVALARSDISDTLPGVAIAISLVPPLAVVGLALESGALHQALGSFLLFITNVIAILASGIIVMGIYRIRHTANQTASRHLLAIGVVGVLLFAVMVPLWTNSQRFGQVSIRLTGVEAVANQWASASGWSVLGVSSIDNKVLVDITGESSPPSLAELRKELDAAGLSNEDIRVQFLAGRFLPVPK